MATKENLLKLLEENGKQEILSFGEISLKLNKI